MDKQQVGSKTDRIMQLVEDFQSLRVAARERRLGRMADFLSVFEEKRPTLIQPAHIDWNLFSVLGIERDEVRHSAFLAWLLDANADHGQGSTFLRAFVELCGLNISPGLLNRYRVRTEFPWSESVIDILVYRKAEFLIYLENKIFAPEGPNQVDREYRDMRRLGSGLCVPDERMYAIFLTPSGRKPRSGDATRWRSVSYHEMATKFEGLLPGITSTKVHLVLSDWINTVSAFGGSREYLV